MFIFCGGMFRSGSTLQYQIASQLVEDYGIGRRLTWHVPNQFPEIRKLYGSTEELIVFKAHKLTSEMKDEIERNCARVITIHRDIRDVVVSAMRKNNWSFRKIWFHNYPSLWTARFDEWSRMPKALICRYDDLAVDLLGIIHAIATQLGISLGDERARELAQTISLDSQKLRIQSIAEKRSGGHLTTKYDPLSLLHYNHISSGDSGIYRSVLRPAQVSALEDRCHEWMVRWGYQCDSPLLSLTQRIYRKTYISKR